MVFSRIYIYIYIRGPAVSHEKLYAPLLTTEAQIYSKCCKLQPNHNCTCTDTMLNHASSDEYS